MVSTAVSKAANAVLMYRMKRIGIFTLFALFFFIFYSIFPFYFYFHTADMSSTTKSDMKMSDEKPIDIKLRDMEEKILEQTEALKYLRQDNEQKAEKLLSLQKQVKAEKDFYKTYLDKETKTKELIDSPHVSRKVFNQLPASSVYCYGKEKYDRICKFHNLYYHPSRKSFFIILTQESILQNVPKDRFPGLMDLTSIDDHSVFYFQYEEVSQQTFTNIQVEHVQKRTFILSRFHVGNIMHTIHDDILNLYQLIREFAPRNHTHDLPDYADLDLNHYIQLMDAHGALDYGHIFGLLSNYPIRFRSQLENDPEKFTLFQEAIVGQSKAVNWYQYGFLSPQGPIKNKSVDGIKVRQAANFIRFKLGLLDADDEDDLFEKPKQEPNQLVVFSRLENRLILNEEDLLKQLSSKYQLEGKFVRMEQLKFRQQVEILQNTKVAIGMHGSIMIMGIFMPPGSVMIELYPYAVPSENYTPYRTMCRLPGMHLVYRAWENKHEENNKPHPENNAYHGGINHLPLEKQKEITETLTVPQHICCTDPFWLYRIYQDTKVDIHEVELLIDSALEESKTMQLTTRRNDPVILPAKIDSKTIKCTPILDPATSEPIGLKVDWDAPWNGGTVDSYSIWEHIAYKEYIAETNSIELRNDKYQKDTVLGIWIRPVTGSIQGRYSDKVECSLTSGNQPAST